MGRSKTTYLRLLKKFSMAESERASRSPSRLRFLKKFSMADNERASGSSRFKLLKKFSIAESERASRPSSRLRFLKKFSIAESERLSRTLFTAAPATPDAMPPAMAVPTALSERESLVSGMSA